MHTDGKGMTRACATVVVEMNRREHGETPAARNGFIMSISKPNSYYCASCAKQESF